MPAHEIFLIRPEGIFIHADSCPGWYWDYGSEKEDTIGARSPGLLPGPALAGCGISKHSRLPRDYWKLGDRLKVLLPSTDWKSYYLLWITGSFMSWKVSFPLYTARFFVYIRRFSEVDRTQNPALQQAPFVDFLPDFFPNSCLYLGRRPLEKQSVELTIHLGY